MCAETLLKLVRKFLGARWRNTLRLALLLHEVRRPWRIAQPLGLIACRHLQQRVEHTGMFIHRGMRVAHFANRSGTVSTVNSAGSHVITSSQRSGVLTRASGSGLTEKAEQVVRSFAFWL